MLMGATAERGSPQGPPSLMPTTTAQEGHSNIHWDCHVVLPMQSPPRLHWASSLTRSPPQENQSTNGDDPRLQTQSPSKDPTMTSPVQASTLKETSHRSVVENRDRSKASLAHTWFLILQSNQRRRKTSKAWIAQKSFSLTFYCLILQSGRKQCVTQNISVTLQCSALDDWKTRPIKEVKLGHAPLHWSCQPQGLCKKNEIGIQARPKTLDQDSWQDGLRQDSDDVTPPPKSSKEKPSTARVLHWRYPPSSTPTYASSNMRSKKKAQGLQKACLPPKKRSRIQLQLK